MEEEEEEEVVYASPYNELAKKSYKSAGLCSELHLGYKKITKLKDFDKFILLDTLWLNNNRLTNIKGLEENIRIKNLYLHNNRMKTIPEGSFEFLIYTNQLTLYNNQLQGLDNVIKELKGLKYLKVLDLSGNPITEENDYRLRVIAELKTLDTFDKHKINDKERIQAKLLLKKKLDCTNKIRPIPSISLEELKFTKRRIGMLNDIIKRLKYTITTKRLFLEKEFLENDRRKTGYIKEAIFWKLMEGMDLKKILNEEEQDLLISKYKIPTKFKAMSKTGKRIVTDYIHYRGLCEDIVPPLMRVIDNVDIDTSSHVPDISITAKDLDIFVKKTIKKRKDDEEDKLTKTSVMNSDKKIITTTSFTTTPPRIESKATDFGLDPWLVGELNKIVRNIEKDINPNLKPKGEYVDLNKQHVISIFKKFSVYRKTPAIGVAAAIDNLFSPTSYSGSNDNNNNNSSSSSSGSSSSSNDIISSLILRNAIGCHTPGNNTNNNTNTNESKVLQLVLKWKELDYNDSEILENQIGDKAMKCLDTLLDIDTNDDTKNILKKTIATAGVDLTRLVAAKPKAPLTARPSFSNCIQTRVRVINTHLIG